MLNVIGLRSPLYPLDCIYSLEWSQKELDKNLFIVVCTSGENGVQIAQHFKIEK